MDRGAVREPAHHMNSPRTPPSPLLRIATSRDASLSTLLAESSVLARICQQAGVPLRVGMRALRLLEGAQPGDDDFLTCLYGGVSASDRKALIAAARRSAGRTL